MSSIELIGVTKAYEKNKPVIENIHLNIKEGSFTVLLGPSGCGKSTLLRLIAGLEKPQAGEIRIGGKKVNDVQPGDRGVAMVFQSYALYPTMTVRENIEFGLKNIKVPKEEREKRILQVAETVGLTDFLARKPQHLSGGQRQRVALARAIVKDPKVFLMDEPLSNLDAKLRMQIRTELIELYRKLGITFVYVTHDQVEAMSMSTEIVLLNQGQIQQQAAPEILYHQPANLFTAGFIGSPPMNIIPTSSLPMGKVREEHLGFRPEKAKLIDKNGAISADYFSFDGRVVAREMLGDQNLYKVESQHGSVFVKEFSRQILPYGDYQVVVKKADLYGFGQNSTGG